MFRGHLNKFIVTNKLTFILPKRIFTSLILMEFVIFVSTKKFGEKKNKLDTSCGKSKIR